MRARARVWYDPPDPRGLRAYRRPGYRWECSCNPRARGRNSFDRFTDRIHGESQYVHPWNRCMKAIEKHFWEHHRTEARRKICE